MVGNGKGLTAAFVATVREPGTYADGRGTGLLLRVESRKGVEGYKWWVQRIRIKGRQRDLGLGSPPLVSLAEAREKALENKRLVASGGDPLAEKRKGRNTLTFAEAVERFFEAKSEEFSSEKHRNQWRSPFTMYVFPKLGRVPVEEITVRDILRVLQPIWADKNPTARKLRQRIEAVLAYAAVAGYREGDNPARWRGNLSEMLARPSKLAKKEEHNPAVALADAARWWADLAQREGLGAAALRFLVLTGARSGEVREATWGEITLPSKDKTDITDKTPAQWIIPASRMGKTGKPHRVALAPEAVALLESLPRRLGCDFVFPSSKGRPLTDVAVSGLMRKMHVADMARGGPGYLDAMTKRPAVPHGWRSTFRDWAAERGIEKDMAELQLSHTVGGAVERAYRRSDLFERRIAVMAAWAAFLRNEAGERKASGVILLPIAGT